MSRKGIKLSPYLYNFIFLFQAEVAIFHMVNADAIYEETVKSYNQEEFKVVGNCVLRILK